jgi:hypothetical protein
MTFLREFLHDARYAGRVVLVIGRALLGGGT